MCDNLPCSPSQGPGWTHAGCFSKATHHVSEKFHGGWLARTINVSCPACTPARVPPVSAGSWGWA